jgi:hypothetical protein
MTQTNIPAWCQALQIKLMAALDAAWTILDSSDDPAEIRRVRDKAKAVGELAAVARKVALITPAGRKSPADPVAAGLGATQAMVDLKAMVAAPPATTAPMAPPVAAQAEHARRALDKLKGARRGRL